MDNENAYKTVEDAIIKIIVSNLSSYVQEKNVTKADTSRLGDGIQYAVVLRQGSFSSKRIGSDIDNTDYLFTWNVGAELYVKFTNEGEVAARLSEFRWNLSTIILGYQSLNNTPGVRSVDISKGSDVQFIYVKSSPEVPIFSMQEVNFTIEQVVGIINRD